MAFKIKKASSNKKDETPSKDSPSNDRNGAHASDDLYTLRGKSPIGNVGEDVGGVHSADRVVLASENIFDWGSRHRKGLLALLIVVIAAILITAWAITNMRSNRNSASNALYNAYMSSIAPIGEKIDDPEVLADGDPQFTTLNARLDAVYSNTDVGIGQKKGVAQLTRLLHGRAGLELGKGAQSDEILSFTAYAFTPLQAVVGDVALAIAQANDGNLDGAVARLDHVAKREPGLKVWSMLQKAELISTFGTKEKALTAWKKAAKAAKGTPAEEQATQRIAMLKMATGDFGDAQTGAAPSKDAGTPHVDADDAAKTEPNAPLPTAAENGTAGDSAGSAHDATPSDEPRSPTKDDVQRTDEQDGE